jgi:hypothetical protein
MYIQQSAVAVMEGSPFECCHKAGNLQGIITSLAPGILNDIAKVKKILKQFAPKTRRSRYRRLEIFKNLMSFSICPLARHVSCRPSSRKLSGHASRIQIEHKQAFLTEQSLALATEDLRVLAFGY